MTKKYANDIVEDQKQTFFEGLIKYSWIKYKKIRACSVNLTLYYNINSINFIYYV